MRFRTTLLKAGKTATGFVVPDKVVAALGSHKRPPVKVTINGYTYRNTIAVMGGKFMVGVSAEHREKAGVAGGDKIEVDIELDTEPRVVTVPPDLKKAFQRDATAKKAFEGMSYSHKRQYVLAIEGAKAPETRQRRIDKTIEKLREAAAGKKA